MLIKYLSLLGNYSLRSTDPLAAPHLASSSPSSAPSICVVRSENMKRRGEEERIEGQKRRRRKKKNEIEGRDQTWP